MGLAFTIAFVLPLKVCQIVHTYWLLQSRHNTEEFTLFTLDDVDMAFDKIQTLKYSQTFNLKGRLFPSICVIAWYTH